jgi:hypothetical protein
MAESDTKTNIVDVLTDLDGTEDEGDETNRQYYQERDPHHRD